MQKKCYLLSPNDMIIGQYYVFFGPVEGHQEEILVEFLRKKDYVERDDGEAGGETIYKIGIIALLKDTDNEGAPEPGESEQFNNEDFEKMAKEGWAIRDASPTEIVLYGRKT